MLQTKVAEKVKTHFMFNFFSEHHAVYEIMWKNIVQPNRSQVTLRRLSFACWIT